MLAQPANVTDAGSPGWLALIMLGLALRFLIAAISWGSNDAISFWNFSHHITNRGLLTAYRENPEFNHPPIAGYWSTVALQAAVLIGGEPEVIDRATGMLDVSVIVYFCFVFKLPGMLADVLVCWLLYKIWSERQGTKAGLRAATVFAWALAPILVSGYHGNNDTIYAALSLLAVYLLQSKQRPFLAGLALGAAINVKLIPVFLIPPLLASLKNRRQVIAFLGALALCALPFVPLLIAIGPEFYRNALAYKPGPNRWGLMLPLTWNGGHPPTYAADPILMAFSDYGRFLLLALVVAWSVIAARLRRWTLYEIAAVTYAIFLVFATGFGVQYTVVVAPLLCAVSLRFGAVYCTSAGLFLLYTYFLYWDGGVPLGSMFVGYIPKVSALIGVFAWATLVVFLVQTMRRKAQAGNRLPTLTDPLAWEPAK